MFKGLKDKTANFGSDLETTKKEKWKFKTQEH